MAVVLLGLLAGGLGAGVFLTQQPATVEAAPPAQTDTACVDDEANEGSEDEASEANEGPECEQNEANEGPENEANEANEAGETDEASETEEAVSPDQASISADQAKAAAEAAHSGAKAVAVELENEGGKIAYEVALDNGLEVLVDATTGDVLGADVE